MSTIRGQSFNLWILFISLVALCLFLYFARFDAGGEDGVYYTTAVAVRDGLVVHKEVFSQYGPVFSLFQGTVMQIFNLESVLSLRYLNSLLLAVTGFIAAITFRRIFSPLVVACALVTWFSSAYFFSDGISMLAWPSVLSLFLAVTVLSFLIEENSAGLTQVTQSITRVALAGVFSGLHLFVRTNLGTTTTSGIVIIFLLACLRPTRKVAVRSLMIFVFLTMTTVIGITLWLALSGALTPFLDQSIRAPADYYMSGQPTPGITNGEIPIEHMARFAILYGLPALLVLFVGVLLASYTASDKYQKLIGLLGGLLAILVAIFLWNKGLGHDPFRRFAPLYGLVLGGLVLGPVFGSRLLTSTHHGRFLDERGEDQLPRLLAVGFSVASVLQLYPGDDPRHLFWVGLIPMMVVLGEVVRLDIVKIKWLVPAVFAIWTVSSGISPAIENARVPRVTVTDDIAYRGLLVKAEQKEHFDRISDSLNGLPKAKDPIVLCEDAQIASWFGEFSSADRMYVTWSWQLGFHSMKKMREASLSAKPPVLFCGTLDEADKWSNDNGYKILDSTGPIVVLTRKG